MRKKTTIIVCLLLVACMLMVSAVVYAGKPDKPPKPPPGGGPDPTGTIYFRYNDGQGLAVWAMNADGSEKTKQIIESGVDFEWYNNHRISLNVEFGTPSRVKHGDYHWYLRFEGIYDQSGDPVTYPDGTGRREIFAVKDDNSVSVQLTNDPTLESRRSTAPLPVWGIGDNSISWGAMRQITGEQYPTDFGIYSAELEWDENGDGDLVGLSEAPYRIWDTGYNINYYGKQLPDMRTGHDWAPDETKIVYTKVNGDMYVVDRSIGQESLLTDGICPQWSPDGSKIAFIADFFCLKTINPDGTGEQIIEEPRGGRSWSETIYNHGFSPDGNFLVYMIHGVSFKTEPPGHYFHIYTIGVDSSGKNCVTKDLAKDSYKTSHAWR